MRLAASHAPAGFVLICLLLAAGPLGCNGSPTTHDGGEPLTRRQEAIRAGRGFLRARQQADGAWPTAPEGFEGGSTALATWALLATDPDADGEDLPDALAWLDALRTDKTYTVAVRANAYRAALAAGERDRRDALTRDVRRLYANSINGAYTYVIEPKLVDISDQSNSHYAAMGVEAGAEAGVEVPQEYWRQVMGYWLRTQNPDGGWPYSQQGTPSSPSMTAAAIATLGLCRQHLDEGGDGAEAAIDRGVEWLGPRFRGSMRESGVTFYYFLTLDRVERLAGREQIRGVDIGEAMVDELLRRQKPDGGWDGSWGRDVSTAYALLVLSRQKD